MSSPQSSAIREEAQRMHQEGLRVAETLNPTIVGILTELAQKKGLTLPGPISMTVHKDRPGGDYCYAMWPLIRDRGQFLVKVELHSNETFDHLYLKAFLQGRFWDREAEQLGEILHQTTGMEVYAERTQSDGIITFSATWSAH